MTPDLWTLSKVDIRAPIAATGWPVARVELHHGERGRLTDVASAPGGLDGAFAAVSHMMDVPARVASLDVHYAPAARTKAGDDLVATVLIELAIEADGEIFPGRALGHDMLAACVSAYVDAVSAARAARKLHPSNPGKAGAE